MLWLLWSFVEHCSLSFFKVFRLILYCCSILYFVQYGEYSLFLRFLMINKNSNVSKSLIHSFINTHVYCIIEHKYGFIFAICVSYFMRVFNFEWFFWSFSLNIISMLLLLLSIVFIFILWRMWRDVISSVTVLELASSPTLWVRDNERLSPSEIQWETYTQF